MEILARVVIRGRMKRNCFVNMIACAAVIMASHLSSGAQIGCSSNACAVAEQIAEKPQGAIDGKNLVFHLHNFASTAAPVAVFRNGLQLPTDAYRLSGKSVIFTTGFAPGFGDVLEVLYTPIRATTRAAPGVSQPAIGGDRIANAAAEAALRSAEQEGFFWEKESATSDGGFRGVSTSEFLKMLSAHREDQGNREKRSGREEYSERKYSGAQPGGYSALSSSRQDRSPQFLNMVSQSEQETSSGRGQDYLRLHAQRGLEGVDGLGDGLPPAPVLPNVGDQSRSGGALNQPAADSRSRDAQNADSSGLVRLLEQEHTAEAGQRRDGRKSRRAWRRLWP